MGQAPFACDAAGRPVRAVDAGGHVAWALRWAEAELGAATLRLPNGAHVVVRPGTGDHPLLGPCDTVHLVVDGVIGPAVASIAAVSWAAPTCIPAVDVPGALPAGAGTAILNLLATLAVHDRIGSLRYRGPYPTEGLFEALRGSFRVDHDACGRFVADPEGRFGAATISPDVDFVPAPHAWSWPAPRICAQHRDGLERLWIDGRPFDRDGIHHVLVQDGDDHCARVVLADEPWCEVLRVDADGTPKGPIATTPEVPAELVGLALPTTMIDVLAEALAIESAAALRPAIARVLARGITLADTGLAPAHLGPSGVRLHAVLVERALARGGPASLRWMLDALRPTVLRAAVAELAAHIG